MTPIAYVLLFLLWAMLLTASVCTSGVVSAIFFGAMIIVAAFGGRQFGRWVVKRPGQ